MKFAIFFSLVSSVILYSCSPSVDKTDYSSDTLTIDRQADHVYRHESYLNTRSFGKVGCNGMVVMDEDQAIIVDTPVDDESAEELIEWVQNKMGKTVVGVVVTHFHVDCLGGLKAFHEHNIPSYSLERTMVLARQDSVELPQIAFDAYTEMPVGKKRIIVDFLGEGHTRDNVVVYFPDEEVLFGGCLVKCLDSGKGNLADANIDTWSETVRKVKDKYSHAAVVIPGHGEPGNQALLDYTIEMFDGKE